MKMSPGPRQASSLSESVHRQFNMYALMAGAAGVSVLALMQPAEARIAYTPANQSIFPNCQPLSLDLNHDGISDFALSNCVSSVDNAERLSILPPSSRVQSNLIWGRKGFASALKKGFEIRANSKHFQPGNGEMFFAACTNYGQTCTSGGQWNNVTNRYLGLKFVIKGKIHYGWARLSTGGGHHPVATLTGYAYETIPGKPIVTGQKGPDKISVQPASLGHLARGASVISAWRVQQTATITH